MIAMSDLAVTGRPKTSPVWDYFSYDESAKKSKCEVITNVVTKCVGKPSQENLAQT